jgi:hypothetical protein
MIVKTDELGNISVKTHPVKVKFASLHEMKDASFGMGEPRMEYNVSVQLDPSESKEDKELFELLEGEFKKVLKGRAANPNLFPVKSDNIFNEETGKYDKPHPTQKLLKAKTSFPAFPKLVTENGAKLPEGLTEPVTSGSTVQLIFTVVPYDFKSVGIRLELRGVDILEKAAPKTKKVNPEDILKLFEEAK